MKQCLNCSGPLSGYQIKFCSRSCAATVNNRTSPKRKKVLNNVCASCSTMCKRKFCSRTCASNNKNLLHPKAIYRTCPLCQESLPNTLEFFYGRNNSRLSHYCKRCCSKERSTRQRAMKQRCVDYKGGSCSICGYNKHIAALDFHHLDPSQKDFGIATRASTKFETLVHELDKCILVCANCHREIHAQQKEN